MAQKGIAALRIVMPIRRCFVVVSVIPSFAVGNQTTTLAAGYKVFLPAGGAKIIPVVPLVVAVPMAETAVVADEGFLIGAVTAKGLISYKFRNTKILSTGSWDISSLQNKIEQCRRIVFCMALFK